MSIDAYAIADHAGNLSRPAAPTARRALRHRFRLRPRRRQVFLQAGVPEHEAPSRRLERAEAVFTAGLRGF